MRLWRPGVTRHNHEESAVPEGLFRKLPAGPACERCGSRTYVASIEPHPTKPLHTRHAFECPRCYHLMKVTVSPRGKKPEDLARVNQFVANAALRVERQATLVRRLQHQGRDCTRAVALLEVLQESLQALQQYEDYVTRTVAQRAEREPDVAG
jgi:hypothetical protein